MVKTIEDYYTEITAKATELKRLNKECHIATGFLPELSFNSSMGYEVKKDGIVEQKVNDIELRFDTFKKEGLKEVVKSKDIRVSK